MTMPKFEPVGFIDAVTERQTTPSDTEQRCLLPVTDLHASHQLTEAYEAGKRDAIPEWLPKLLNSDQVDFLRNNRLELKYLPIYADQPDPTYIVKWVWEIRDEYGVAICEAHEWLCTVLNNAMLAAAPKGKE